MQIDTDTLIDSLYHFGISTLDLYSVWLRISILQKSFTRKVKASQARIHADFSYKMQMEARGVILTAARVYHSLILSLLCMLFTLPFPKF